MHILRIFFILHFIDSFSYWLIYVRGKYIMQDVALFIGSHNEEIEVEVPLLPQLLVEAGWKVVIFNPIVGRNWIAVRRMQEEDRNNLKQSCLDAARVLGCEKILCDYDVGRSFDWNGKVREELAKVLEQVKPKIVFMHWLYDSHFDHNSMVAISLQALTSCTNLIENKDFNHTWEEVWAYTAGREQSFRFVPEVIAGADEKHMDTAMEALDSFKYPEKMIRNWQRWTKQKCSYWAPIGGTYPYADPLKYIGPSFPAEGTLLKKILKERLIPQQIEPWLTGGRIL